MTHPSIASIRSINPPRPLPSCWAMDQAGSERQAVMIED